MSIIDRLTSLFAPYDCLLCGSEGALLCQPCAGRSLPPLPPRCFRCQLPTPAGRCCAKCRSSTSLYRVQAATAYGGPAQQLIGCLKFRGAQTAAGLMARYIAERTAVTGTPLLVPVPTATGRVRQRGYDQAVLLARALSRQTGWPRLTALARQGQHHQVGSDRQQRLVQLATAYRVLNPADVAGRHIVLIDDVITTGATMSAAARALAAAGAAKVEGVAFAQAQ